MVLFRNIPLAVMRNRIRRRLRAALIHLAADHPLAGRVVVIEARREYAGLEWNKLCQRVWNCCEEQSAGAK